MADATHDASLSFEYDSTQRARIVEQSVRQEVGEISGGRTRASVERDGHTVTVNVTATDLVALRAGLNTWSTLISVAEQCHNLSNE